MLRSSSYSSARRARHCAPALLLIALVVSASCRPEGRPNPPAQASREIPNGESWPPEEQLGLQIQDEGAVDEAPGQNPQLEPHVVVDPGNPSNLVAAFMSVSAERWEVRIFRSTNGGRTWHRCLSPVATDVWRAFDPWLAWAPDGSALFLTLVEVRTGHNGEQGWRLPVFRSSDGGESWSRWAEVPGRTLDRPVMVAGRNAVYVLASEAVGASPIVFAKSAPENGRFRVLGRYNPPNHSYILSDAVMTGDNELVLSLTDRTSLQDRRAKPLFAVTFDEQTKRFGEPWQLGTALFVGAPQLAFDGARGSPHRGHLYAVWGDRTDDGTASLEIAVSGDGGATWHEPATVSTGREKPSFLTLPAAAVDSRGRLGIAWREHVGDLSTGCSTVHFAVSPDGGRSFPLRQELTTKPSCPDRPANRIDLNGIPLLDRWPGGGDYAGLAAGSDGVFHPVWADSRAGAWRIRTARIEFKPAPSSSKDAVRDTDVISRMSSD